MSASDHLSHYQFKAFLDYPQRNQIRAYHSETGEEVGHLHWANAEHTSAAGRRRKLGEVTHVEIEKEHQHKGLAYHMYKMAEEIGPQPLTPKTDVSRQGRAFFNKIGGPSV